MTTRPNCDHLAARRGESTYGPRPPAHTEPVSPLGDLARTQKAFADALLDLASGIPPGLVGPDGRPSLKRFNVYRNNVVVGLTNTLRDAFPAVARIVGEAFFTAMARIYATTHLPSSPVMLAYGESFPGFVRGFEPAAVPLPYLADVARLERAWLEAYHAPEAQALSIGALAALEVEDLMNLRVTLHPSLRIVRSEFPVLTLWQAQVAGGDPAWIDLSTGGQDVLVTRPDADVDLRSLPPGGSAFIEALRKGLPAHEAMACGLAADDRFDLTAHLIGLVEAGALVGLECASGRSLP